MQRSPSLSRSGMIIFVIINNTWNYKTKGQLFILLSLADCDAWFVPSGFCRWEITVICVFLFREGKRTKKEDYVFSSFYFRDNRTNRILFSSFSSLSGEHLWRRRKDEIIIIFVFVLKYLFFRLRPRITKTKFGRKLATIHDNHKFLRINKTKGKYHDLLIECTM